MRADSTCATTIHWYPEQELGWTECEDHFNTLHFNALAAMAIGGEMNNGNYLAAN